MNLNLFRASAVLSILVVTALRLSAQTADYSVPMGYVNLAINPSPDGVTYALTQFSAPLETIATITGHASGTIFSPTTNTLTDATGGWAAGSLAAAGAPYLVKVTDGPAAGYSFLITANTGTVLTVDPQGSDLTALGVVAGNHYEILQADTLRSLLGSPSDGVVGGTSAQLSSNQIDKVLLNDSTGVARFYYFDTTTSQWLRVGSAASQDNLLILPSNGLTYYRVSTTPLSFTLTGAVPATNSVVRLPGTGSTIFAPFFPVSTTLDALGLQGLPSWRKMGDPGVTLNDADLVVATDALGVQRPYYFDGTIWKRVGSNANQGATIIPVGSAFYCTRFGGTSDTWMRAMPYTLN